MITRKATPKPQHLEKGGHPPHNSKPSVSRYTKPYTHISVRKQHPNTQTPTNTPPNYQQIHTLECSEQDLLTKMRIWCDFWKGRNWGSTKSSRFVIFRAGMLVSAYLPPTQYIVAPWPRPQDVGVWVKASYTGILGAASHDIRDCPSFHLFLRLT